jgi:hypothetical protein
MSRLGLGRTAPRSAETLITTPSEKTDVHSLRRDFEHVLLIWVILGALAAVACLIFLVLTVGNRYPAPVRPGTTQSQK